MKSILITVALVFSLLLIPPAVSAAEPDGSDNYTFDNFTLGINVLAPLPTPSGNGGWGGYYQVDTDFCGVSGDFHIDSSGKVIRAVEAGCKDGALTVTIEKGTIALGENGRRLTSLEILEDTDPPELPEGNFIGVPYSLGPSGASFNPPLTLTWAFDPEDLPEGVDPEDLEIVYWDGDEWLVLAGVVDTVNNTVTAEVDHFTTFALVSPAAEVVVAPTPPIPTPPPAPPEPTQPPAEPTPPPTEPITPPLEPEPPFNWLFVIVPIVAVLIIGGAIFYSRRRRRSEN